MIYWFCFNITLPIVQLNVYFIMHFVEMYTIGNACIPVSGIIVHLRANYHTLWFCFPNTIGHTKRVHILSAAAGVCTYACFVIAISCVRVSGILRNIPDRRQHKRACRHWFGRLFVNARGVCAPCFTWYIPCSIGTGECGIYIVIISSALNITHSGTFYYLIKTDSQFGLCVCGLHCLAQSDCKSM